MKVKLCVVLILLCISKLVVAQISDAPTPVDAPETVVKKDETAVSMMPASLDSKPAEVVKEKGDASLLPGVPTPKKDQASLPMMATSSSDNKSVEAVEPVNDASPLAASDATMEKKEPTIESHGTSTSQEETAPINSVPDAPQQEFQAPGDVSTDSSHVPQEPVVKMIRKDDDELTTGGSGGMAEDVLLFGSGALIVLLAAAVMVVCRWCKCCLFAEEKQKDKMTPMKVEADVENGNVHTTDADWDDWVEEDMPTDTTRLIQHSHSGSSHSSGEGDMLSRKSKSRTSSGSGVTSIKGVPPRRSTPSPASMKPKKKAIGSRMSTPIKQDDEDLFASVGLEVTPTFVEPVKKLAEPVAEWGDDYLDDLSD